MYVKWSFWNMSDHDTAENPPMDPIQRENQSPCNDLQDLN